MMQKENLLHEMCDEIEEDLQQSLHEILERAINLSQIADDAEEAADKAENLQIRSANRESPFREIACFWVGVVVTIFTVTMIAFLIYEITRFITHDEGVSLAKVNGTKIKVNY